jgi:putative Ca2+/H+ antiporter (TMEM165/GDT1 family)
MFKGRVHFGVLFTAFGLIFIAELPDKTAYTVLLLASRNKPLPVLLGSWLAFLVQGCVAVALGSLFAKLSPEIVRWTSAGLFLTFGIWLLVSKVEESAVPERGSRRKAFAEAFLLVFLAETGDATQIGTAALVARFGERWSVLVGSTLALWAVSALAVTLGNKLGSRIPKRPLRRAAGALFIVFAIASAFVGF